MNTTEFQQFETDFAAAFPSAGSRLMANMDTRRAWRDALDDVALVDAVSAIGSLLRGGEGSKEIYFDDFPRQIIAQAKSWAAERARSNHFKWDGEPVGRPVCLKCGESGVVSIYHQSTVAAVQKDREAFIANGRELTAFACCTCQSGARYAGSFVGKKNPVPFFAKYDPERMVPVASVAHAPMLTPEEGQMGCMELFKKIMASPRGRPQTGPERRRDVAEWILAHIESFAPAEVAGLLEYHGGGSDPEGFN